MCSKQNTRLNLSVFNMITGIKESKSLTKHLSRECKCKFDGRKCNSNQNWNNDECWCECKNHNICENDYIWNPAACSCENGTYLTYIMGDSAIKFDETVDADAEAKSNDEETKTSPPNFNKKK